MEPLTLAMIQAADLAAADAAECRKYAAAKEKPPPGRQPGKAEEKNYLFEFYHKKGA